MTHRLRIMVASTAILLACTSDDPRDESRDVLPGETAAEETGATRGLFVGAPTAAAQLVTVGPDSMAAALQRPGAIFLPMSLFSVERDGIPNEFPPADSLAARLEAAGIRGERIVIVGEPIPAGRAYAAFDYLGLGDRAALLDGGPAALRTDSAAAAPSAGAAPPAQPATGGSARLDIDVRDDMIVDADWVHARLNDAGVVILDARPPAEFSGETPGEGITRPGHIPGARNLFWQTLVQSADNPRLKDEAELRRLFEQAGATAGKTIVAYCRTGGQSAFLYTVARHLGYDVKLYDGSFVDWSRTSYPVER